MFRTHMATGMPLFVGIPPSRVRPCLDEMSNCSPIDPMATTTMVPGMSSPPTASDDPDAPSLILEPSVVSGDPLTSTTNSDTRVGPNGVPSHMRCVTVVKAVLLDLRAYPDSIESTTNGAMLAKLYMTAERLDVVDSWVVPGTFGLVYVQGRSLDESPTLKPHAEESSEHDGDLVEEALAEQLKLLCLGGPSADALASESKQSLALQVMRQKALSLLGIGPSDIAKMWKLSSADFSWWLVLLKHA